LTVRKRKSSSTNSRLATSVINRTIGTATSKMPAGLGIQILAPPGGPGLLGKGKQSGGHGAGLSNRDGLIPANAMGLQHWLGHPLAFAHGHPHSARLNKYVATASVPVRNGENPPPASGLASPTSSLAGVAMGGMPADFRSIAQAWSRCSMIWKTVWHGNRNNSADLSENRHDLFFFRRHV